MEAMRLIKRCTGEEKRRAGVGGGGGVDEVMSLIKGIQVKRRGGQV